jgi:hypothetical protein
VAGLNPLPIIQGVGRWLVNWLIRAPLQFQPSLFSMFVFCILWFLIVRRGFAQSWHFLVRFVTATIERSLGAILLVEYLVTSRRRRDGRSPAQWAYMISEPIDFWLNAVARSYERHLKSTSPQRARWPLKSVIAIFLILTIPWYVRPHLPAGNNLRGGISEAYRKWDSFTLYLRGKRTISISHSALPVFRPTAIRQADGSVLLNLGKGHARQRVSVFAGSVSSARPKTRAIAIVVLNNVGIARVRPAPSVRRFFAPKLPISCVAGTVVLHVVIK